MLHIEYLVEDKSTGIFVDAIMQQICGRFQDITFHCTSFHGIGNIPKGDSVQQIKTGLLLNDLPPYLRGFSNSLLGIPVLVVVIVDNDDREQYTFRHQVQQLIDANIGTLDNILCIAVEELEAWLLGDVAAITIAYPNANITVIQKYKQDSICGTWEALADAIYPGGSRKLKKDDEQYRLIGSVKCEWAKKIGGNLSIDNNRSPSFKYFKEELFKRIAKN